MHKMGVRTLPRGFPGIEWVNRPSARKSAWGSHSSGHHFYSPLEGHRKDSHQPQGLLTIATFCTGSLPAGCGRSQALSGQLSDVTYSVSAYERRKMGDNL